MLLVYILVTTIQECGRVISCSIPSIDFGTSEWPKCDCCPSNEWWYKDCTNESMPPLNQLLCKPKLYYRLIHL